MVWDWGQAINSVKHQIEQLKMKPWSEYVIKLTQEELAELHKWIKWKTKDGKYFEFFPKENKLIVYKPKEKNEKCVEEVFKEWGNTEDAMDVCSDNLVSFSLDSEEVTEKEKEVTEKEKEVTEKEKEVAEKEKEVKRLDYENYLASLSLNVADTIKNILLWIQNKNIKKEEVRKKLLEIKKILKNYEVIWSESDKKSYIEWLNLIKHFYKKDKDIIELLDEIIKLIKNAKLNSAVA